MAKFDTSKIANWESLDTEARLKALMEADIPDAVDLTQYVSKATADKYASEAADWKKKFNSKLTEDEQKKAAEDEAKAALEKKYAELLKKTTVAEYKAQYLGLGYSDDTAGKMAEAQAAGDSAKMFELMTAEQSAMKEKMKKDLLNGTPKPGGAPDGDNKAKTPDIVLAEKLAAESKEAGKSASDAQKKYFG